LDDVFKNIVSLNAPVALAIFTANTFKTLNKTAGLKPLLRSRKEIVEIVEYKLEFESVRDIFRYIKKSGVSGSRRLLSYKETKRLMQEYPFNYLEFEVAFIH